MFPPLLSFKFFHQNAQLVGQFGQILVGTATAGRNQLFQIFGSVDQTDISGGTGRSTAGLGSGGAVDALSQNSVFQQIMPLSPVARFFTAWKE